MGFSEVAERGDGFLRGRIDGNLIIGMGDGHSTYSYKLAIFYD